VLAVLAAHIVSSFAGYERLVRSVLYFMVQSKGRYLSAH
jgi:hypothetical protein